MTDNLLQLIDLRSDLLLAELSDRTKRCAITWDKVSYSTYHTTFVWNDDWHDIYVSLLRGSYVLDVVKNGKNVLTTNSYVNSQIVVLYNDITDSVDNDVIKQVIQDLNSLKLNLVLKGSGGLIAGGAANLHSLSFAMAKNLLIQDILYMYNPSGTLDVLTSDNNTRNVLSDIKNISDVKVDAKNGKIFWSQRNIIKHCGLDGVTDVAIIDLPNYDEVRAFALDKINRKIYFVADKLNDSGDNLIYDVKRCDYDGSHIESICDGNSHICSPTSIDIDLENKYVFWCDSYGLTEGNIHRANLDGSGVTILASTNGYVRTLCVYQKHLYLGGSGFLGRINEQGGDEFVFAHTGMSVIDSISIGQSGVMYIADVGVNKIFSVNLRDYKIKVLVDESNGINNICVR